MQEPVQIRMGGYGPPTTTHSRALKMIGDRLEASVPAPRSPVLRSVGNPDYRMRHVFEGKLFQLAIFAYTQNDRKCVGSVAAQNTEVRRPRLGVHREVLDRDVSRCRPEQGCNGGAGVPEFRGGRSQKNLLGVERIELCSTRIGCEQDPLRSKGQGPHRSQFRTAVSHRYGGRLRARHVGSERLVEE